LSFSIFPHDLPLSPQKMVGGYFLTRKTSFTGDEMKIMAAGDDNVVDGPATVHLLDLRRRLPPPVLHPGDQRRLLNSCTPTLQPINTYFVP
jgi:hypothetical protein